MSKLILLLPTLAALVYAVSVQASKDEHQVLKQSWAELNFRLYDWKGPGIGPLETYKLLTQLEKIYSSTDDQRLANKKDSIRALRKASHLSKKRCTKESMDELDRLIITNKLHKINIIPYLLDAKKRRKYFCQEKAKTGFFSSIWKK